MTFEEHIIKRLRRDVTAARTRNVSQLVICVDELSVLLHAATASNAVAPPAEPSDASVFARLREDIGDDARRVDALTDRLNDVSTGIQARLDRFDQAIANLQNRQSNIDVKMNDIDVDLALRLNDISKRVDVLACNLGALSKTTAASPTLASLHHHLRNITRIVGDAANHTCVDEDE